MRLTPRALGCALTLACGLTDGAAAAEEPPRTSSLGWVRLPGAESCIGPRELAQAAEQRLGRAAFVSPAVAVVSIEGRIESAPDGGGFRAHLALADARGWVLGTRDLQAPGTSCRALDEQIGLVVALFVDPAAALAPAEAARLVAPPPLVIVERVLVPTSAPAPPVAREPWKLSLTIGPAFSVGMLPGIGVAAALRGELVPPSFLPIEVGGAVWLPARAAAADAPSKRVTLSLAYGSLGLCPLAWSDDRTRLRGCAAIQIGAIDAVGAGFASSDTAGHEQAVIQAAIEARAIRRLVGPLEIGVGLGLVVPFRRARFFYLDAAQNEQELFRMSPIAGLAEATLGITFP